MEFIRESDQMQEGKGRKTPHSVCSICLEGVVENKGRSVAKLHCNHEFHLDCIGSAFNVKGVMQCPNCRKIEKGQWLFANGARSCPEFSFEDWAHDEDLYDPSYAEIPLGLQWCPFSGLNRLPSSFEEGDPPSTAYHDLMGHHTVFTERTTPPTAAHSCPYIAYFQLQPSSSSSTESITDGPGPAPGPTFAHHWSGPAEMSSSQAFTTVDLHYHTWDHHPDRSIRPDSQSGSFVHPFLLPHGSGPRTMVAPPNPTRPHAYHQRSPIYPPGRRSGAPRGMPASSSESGFVVLPQGRTHPEAENPLRNRFYAWERDRFAPFPLIPVDRESNWWGPDNRTSSYWHRHGGERTTTTPQNRAESSSYSSARLHPFI